jgi:hypothetical protein
MQEFRNVAAQDFACWNVFRRRRPDASSAIGIISLSHVDRTGEYYMSQDFETIRELSLTELDQVGGGQSELSVSIGGLNELIDTVHAIPSGAVTNVRGLVEDLAGGLLGSLGGLAGK